MVLFHYFQFFFLDVLIVCYGPVRPIGPSVCEPTRSHVMESMRGPSYDTSHFGEKEWSNLKPRAKKKKKGLIIRCKVLKHNYFFYKRSWQVTRAWRWLLSYIDPLAKKTKNFSVNKFTNSTQNQPCSIPSFTFLLSRRKRKPTGTRDGSILLCSVLPASTFNSVCHSLEHQQNDRIRSSNWSLINPTDLVTWNRSLTHYLQPFFFFLYSQGKEYASSTH